MTEVKTILHPGRLDTKPGWIYRRFFPDEAYRVLEVLVITPDFESVSAHPQLMEFVGLEITILRVEALSFAEQCRLDFDSVDPEDLPYDEDPYDHD